MSNFSKATSTAIRASEMAETYSNYYTSEEQRESIALHVGNQTKPFKSAFNKRVEQQNRRNERRGRPVYDLI